MDNANTEFDQELIKKKFPKLHNIFFGPLQPLQEQLIFGSLFIMSFECLKGFVEENFQLFFSTGFESDGKGGIQWKLPDNFKDTKKKYQENYRQLCFRILNEEVKGISSFQTSIAWFYDMEAINDDDFKIIVSSNKIRNDLAHELYKWILDDSIPVLTKQFIYNPLNLYFKISNWWIVNFEASIDPEAYKKYSKVDMESAMSFNVQILLQILDRLFPEKKEAQ